MFKRQVWHWERGLVTFQDVEDIQATGLNHLFDYSIIYSRRISNFWFAFSRSPPQSNRSNVFRHSRTPSKERTKI